MRRRADNNDPLVIAENILAAKWTLPILRVLGDGPSRFTGLRTAIPAVSANILAGRLRDLEEVGIIHKKALPPPAQYQVYALTDLGKAAGPILLAIDRWASHFPRQRAPRPKSHNLSQEEKHV